ncbi:MAG: hypothetical protein R8J84_00540 [Mariprofundales bacterium]
MTLHTPLTNIMPHKVAAAFQSSFIWRIPSLMAILIGLPLIGVGLQGQSIWSYLSFPPAMPSLHHPEFSWPLFLVIAAIACLTLASIASLIRQRKAVNPSFTRYPMPIWGWAALTIWIGTWILAWTRFDWFSPLQFYTFAPLWFSFIVLLNALTYHRSGRCLITHAPRYLLRLFLVSAIFWWYFEFLNRFVQNWHYLGLAPGGVLLYITSSSIAFSTVLPGVISMIEFLETTPLFSNSSHGVPFRFHPQPVAYSFISLATVGLLVLGIMPNTAFPMVWVAPLLLVVASQLLIGEPNLLTACANDRWHQLYTPMCAALLCGFFWEMWNAFSQAVWHYELPYVNRFHLFEMPILGYIGYLPFGLECAVIAALVKR